MRGRKQLYNEVINLTDKLATMYSMLVTLAPLNIRHRPITVPIMPPKKDETASTLHTFIATALL